MDLLQIKNISNGLLRRKNAQLLPVKHFVFSTLLLTFWGVSAKGMKLHVFIIATLQNLYRQANKIVLQPIYEVSGKCQNCFIHDCEELIEILNIK